MSMTSSFRVEDYMVRDVVTVHPETNVNEAIGLLLKHSISGMPVVDEAGRLVGMLSERDCLKAFVSARYYDEPTSCVKDLMSEPKATVGPQADILEVAELFLHKNLRRLPVLQDDRLVGQISRRDVLRALQEWHWSEK
jgi:CBS domain-containing protein